MFRSNMNDTRSGFSLIELLLAFAIVIFFFATILQLFIQVKTASEMSKNSYFALLDAQTVMERIRETDFDAITSTYGQGVTTEFLPTTFISPGLNWIHVDSSNPELLQVEIYVHWRDGFGRTIGEDLDLDGDIDTGEDVNGNGKLDSPVVLMSLIADL